VVGDKCKLYQGIRRGGEEEIYGFEDEPSARNGSSR
jgi:hypothetical protein